MIKRLLASNIGLVTRAPDKLADPLLVIGKVFWGNQVLGKAGCSLSTASSSARSFSVSRLKATAAIRWCPPSDQAKQSWLGRMKRGIRKRAIRRLSGFIGGNCSRVGGGKMVEQHATEKPVVLNSIFKILNACVLATAPPQNCLSSALLAYLHSVTIRTERLQRKL